MICDTRTKKFIQLQNYLKKKKCNNDYHNFATIVNPATHQNDLHLYWDWPENKTVDPLTLPRTNRINKYNFRCPRCREKFQISLGQFTAGMRCPCERTGGGSRKERYCIQFFEMLYKEIAERQKTIEDVGKIDGYFPKKNLVIELHGCHWHGCGSNLMT